MITDSELLELIAAKVGKIDQDVEDLKKRQTS